MALSAMMAMAAEPTDPSVYEQRQRRHWCGATHERDPLTGIDDAGCAKRLPPIFDREFTCPSAWSSLSGFVAPSARAEDTAVHDELAHIVPPGTAIDAKVTVGVIRRQRTGGKPLVRYLGNGQERDGHQPWSSSKAFAAAHAAARLRTLRRDIGLDASERGDALGDLMTIVATYDANTSRPGVTSNALGAYFHALGGHAAADDFLHQVIGSDGSESFGGDYGEPVPSSVGYVLRPGGGSGPSQSVAPDPPPQPPIGNRMSCLSMAEWLRRIVCTREEAVDGTGSGWEWADSAAMMYGANSSGMFPGLQWGGLSMGTDVYLQGAVDLQRMDARSHGLWRIFSKLGAGVSSTAHPGRFEITLNAYGCFPVIGERDHLPSRGLEFVLSAAVVSDVEHDDGKRADEAMRSLVANVTALLLERYDGHAGRGFSAFSTV